MLTLYYAPLTCALATHLALEEAGAAYAAKRVDLASAEQTKAAYRAINPKGRVPALVTPHGVLTETPALLAYVAQTHPAARLAPLDDPFAFAQVQSFNNYLCSTVHVAHAHRPRANRWADDAAAQEAMRQKVPQNMTDCFNLIQDEYFKGPWVMGDAYTICDAYLFNLGLWLEGDGVDIAKFPRIAEHAKRMADRPAVARVLAIHRGPG